MVIWYFRRDILLLFVGGNYYWYCPRQLLPVFMGGDTIASCSIRRMGDDYDYRVGGGHACKAAADDDGLIRWKTGRHRANA